MTTDLSERSLFIDDATGTPLDVSDLLVGSLGDLAKRMFPTMDLTGPMHERPKHVRSGFGDYATATITLEKTTATYAAFVIGAETSMPRTFTLTRRTTGTDQTWVCEGNMTSVFCPTEPAENGVDTIEMEWEFTGTDTVT